MIGISSVLQALQTLLLCGGPVTVVEKHGWTPLHICGIHGRNICLQVDYPP